MPYIYKEYPRTLHKWQDQTCTVRTDEEKAAAIAAGWSLEPVMSEPAPVPVLEPEPVVEEPVEPKKRKRKGDDA